MLLVAIDATCCRRKISQRITEEKADYVICLPGSGEGSSSPGAPSVTSVAGSSAAMLDAIALDQGRPALALLGVSC